MSIDMTRHLPVVEPAPLHDLMARLRMTAAQRIAFYNSYAQDGVDFMRALLQRMIQSGEVNQR